MTFQASTVSPLNTKQVYTCNLCQRELPHTRLLGITWLGGGEEGREPKAAGISRLAFTTAKGAADHICPDCVKELSDLRSGIARHLVLG